MTAAKVWTWTLTTWVIALIATSVRAAEQQPPPREVSAAVQAQPKLVIKTEDLFPLTRPTRLGLFTVVPPQTNGEVIRVSVPVGELVSKAAHAISEANHRRAERKADEHVRIDLETFLAAPANRNAAPTER
jgi:hypothetical protein